jgi:hypothetical protein
LPLMRPRWRWTPAACGRRMPQALHGWGQSRGLN